MSEEFQAGHFCRELLDTDGRFVAAAVIDQQDFVIPIERSEKSHPLPEGLLDG
jgi:hypothetical protein